MTSPLRLPPGWRSHPSSDPCVLALAHPGRLPVSGVLPSLALTTDPGPLVGPGDLEDADEWVDDLGRTVLYRRWSPEGRLAVVHESWAWPDVGPARLVATVAREDYPDLCDLFEWAAELVDPEGLTGLPRPA